MRPGFLRLLLTMAAAAMPCLASSVTLAWDPSPSTNRIVDYSVYWGPATRFYTNHYHAGTNFSAIITNLLPGRTYFFTATAVDYVGQESGFSAEVSTTTPDGTTNIISVTLTIQTNPAVSGQWAAWAVLPVRTMTNPPDTIYYRSIMGITNIGASRRILKLNSSTLVFTNS